MTGMSMPMKALVGLVVALGCSVAGYVAGDHNRNNAWLAMQANAERQAKEKLQAALVRGDDLSSKLLKQQDQIIQLKAEVSHAIENTTSGRPCFNGPTLRLLDQAPGISVRGLPPSTGSAAAVGGAAATVRGDESVAESADAAAPYSSDTQVALWIVDVTSRFETCRTRLNALIGWHTP